MQLVHVRHAHHVRNLISSKLHASKTLILLSVWQISVIGKLRSLVPMETVKTVISALSQTLVLTNVSRRLTINNAFSKYVIGKLKSSLTVIVSNVLYVPNLIFHKLNV